MTVRQLTDVSQAYGVSNPWPTPRPSGSAGGIAEKVTYYAIVDALSSREKPADVLRRIKHEGGQRDEAFGHDLAWRPTFLLYYGERGNLDNTMHEIGADEADRIQTWIRDSG